MMRQEKLKSLWIITTDKLARILLRIGMKVRVNKEGLMNSKSRPHRVKKGKGCFRRQPKHAKKP